MFFVIHFVLLSHLSCFFSFFVKLWWSYLDLIRYSVKDKLQSKIKLLFTSKITNKLKEVNLTIYKPNRK